MGETRGASATGEGGLHEDLSREEEVVGSSDRAFGLTLAAVCALVGGIRLVLAHDGALWWLTAAVLLAMLAQLRPAILAPLNRVWLRLGLLLYKVTNPVVMALIFYTTVMPIGLVMRALGKDPLRLRRDSAAASYWIARDPSAAAADSMKRQF